MEGYFVPPPRQFCKNSYDHFKDCPIPDIFEKFIDEDIIHFLIDEVTIYALFLNENYSKISPEEKKSFIAILILVIINCREEIFIGIHVKI